MTTAPDVLRGPGVGDDVHDVAIGGFSRLRHQNTLLLEAVAGRWSVASSDIRALCFLAGAGDTTPKKVAEFLGITTGAMTSLVDRVERAGLAQRTAHPTDRRSIVIELTPRGRSAVGDTMSRYRIAFGTVVPDGDLAAVGELFDRLATAFEAQLSEVDPARP